MKEKNKTLIIFVLVLIGICLLFYFRGRDQRDLRENGVIVQAKILKVLNPYKGGVYFSFYCEFEFNGEVKRAFSESRVDRHANYYLGKTLPALYSERTGALRLLFTSEDYQEYDREYPLDTLQNLNSKNSSSHL